MGYLLKEALKALCGVNQWSYAVFWKFGCQNPKLLIWEECYHGNLPCSNAPHNSTMGNQGLILQKQEGYHNEAQVGDRVGLLMDKMMMNNHVNMVGEGLVGRTAFTGNYQWIVSGNYNENAYPAEVLNEIRLQFSAGMQTIAVIPVIPHGVVQLGSPLAIMENVGFVHDVKSLILQVGCVPSAFISDNYMAKNDCSMYGLPVADVTSVSLNLHGNSAQMNSSSIVADSFNLPRNSSQTVRLAHQSSNSLLTQFQDNLQVSGSTFVMPNLTQDACKSLGDYAAKISANVDCIVPPPSSQVENKNNIGVAMPLKPDSLINQPSGSHILGSRVNYPQSSASCRSSTLSKQSIVPHGGIPERNHLVSGASSSISTPLVSTLKGHHATLNRCDSNVMSGNSDLAVGKNGQHSHSLQNSSHANTVFYDADSSIGELGGLLNTGDHLSSSSVLGHPNHDNSAGNSEHPATHNPGKSHDNDVHGILKAYPKLPEHILSGNFIPDDLCNGSQVPSLKDPVSEDVFFQSSAGNDLYDVLGADFRNEILNGSNSKLHNRYGANTKDQRKHLPTVKLQNLGSEAYSDYYDGISESGVFSSSGSDHLLDAVISGVSSAGRQISEDSMSCRTSLSKISSSSVPSTPHSNPPISGLINMSDQIQGQLFGLSKPMLTVGEPIGGSIRSSCGKSDGGSCSLISSTYGSQISSWIEQGTSGSISTANSKKPDEAGKTNRKRLKPGENPRPRPKDRQMIQDRVKELREIVPNGAKCSIDALLERTIKHMLFLQSVTKHADKLKQTVESKIINREGGMLVKDNFEGGATWAFELGNQSMVCPIVVEDLNPPRQLLIEMLCEERGFFLEIADIIRGLGLTILKGVMEARNDKIWARFAVEANRDVTRMEVFISLVHLLEQTLKGSTTSAHGTTDEDLGVHPAAMAGKQQLVGPIVCGEPSAM